MTRSNPTSTLAALALLAACGGGEPDEADAGGDTGSDVANDGIAPDVEPADLAGETGDTGEVDPADATPDDGSDPADAEETDTADAAPDGSEDTGPVLGPVLDVAIQWPIFAAPADPLDEAGVSGCTVYMDEQCGPGGTVQRCEIYDAGASAWVDEPDPLLRRAYLYDRWYEKFSAPDGQTAERVFTEEMPPGTPESAWTDPAVFAGWAGAGDSAIWTGTALNAYILRYLVTGTEADYFRMEEKTRVMVHFFDVTGIPGYLARYHYLSVPAGTPPSTEHVFNYPPDDNLDHRDIEAPETLDFLPDLYSTGLGTPRWSGDPSIDQYNGPMVAFPMVYGLLRDDALKERIAHHMVCYLHGLRRIEITNLQMNDAALDAFNQLFGGPGALNLDPGSIDFTTLDRIVMYVHPQINVNNEDTYPRECGDFVEMEPWRVIDAASGRFVLDVLELTQDIARPENRRNQINHFYIPSIRGGDAMHMMHLTVMAYAFTGDERYLDFLSDELMANIRAAEVAQTMSAFLMPKFCRRFYGTNITAGPLWAFNNLLADSELDVWMQEVSRDEMWEKETRDIGNVNTNLMYAGSVSPEIGGDGRLQAIAYALEELPRFGGNGGVLDDPRRTYHRPYLEVVDRLPEGVTPQCPTAEERATCERPIEIFGATLEGEDISDPCTGAPWECVMDDGLCTTAVASAPLPGPIRKWADYAWQRSAFDIGDEGGNGRTQSPGTDYSEQYWMARFYGFLEERAEVLAWRDTSAPCDD